METMNIPSLMLLLAFSFFSLLLLNRAEARPVRSRALAPAPPPQLQMLCRKTSYPRICTRTMVRFINRTSPLNDPMFIFRTSIMAAETKARKAIRQVDRLIASEKNAAAVESLRSCREFFNNAVESIQTAMDKIQYRDKLTIRVVLSSAITAFSSCDNEFMGPSKLSTTNAIASHIIDNSLVFSKLVRWR